MIAHHYLMRRGEQLLAANRERLRGHERADRPLLGCCFLRSPASRCLHGRAPVMRVDTVQAARHEGAHGLTPLEAIR